MGFFLAMALANLGIGFAVAVVLRHRYESVVANADEPVADPWDMGLLALAVNTAAPPEPKQEPEPPIGAPPVESVEAPVLPAAPASPQAEAVVTYQSTVQQYSERLGDADQQLRSFADSLDAAAIESCLSALRMATEEYLAQRRDNTPAVADLAASLEPGDACQQLQAAVERQDQQIEQAQQRFDLFNADGELATECNELVLETSRLLDAHLDVRDAVETLQVDLQRAEHRLNDPQLFFDRDECTGLASRAGLEAAVRKFWSRDPHRMRTLCAAMIDIDQCAALNHAHGYRAGNDVLGAVGRSLHSEQRGDILIGRFSGQRFCVLFPDTDLRLTTNVVERIRQMLELTHFVRSTGHIRLTVSCGVAESTRDDTPMSLFERTEATLREAKRYGRNRTFLHEGKYPAPVIPPNFSLEERELTI